MEGRFVLLVSILMLALIHQSNGAAFRKISAPLYDENFMKKLCSFLGATYVRSAKDPLCWYTWCHNGHPYHMQCPPGRSVSEHFYWRNDDPCTEIDQKERCLLGFLKTMHLGREKKTDIAVETKEETLDLKPARTTIYEEPESEAKSFVHEFEPVYKSPNDGGARQAPLPLDDKSHDPEPLPEAEPIPGDFYDDNAEDEGREKKEVKVHSPHKDKTHVMEAYMPPMPQIPHYLGYPYYHGPYSYFPQHNFLAPIKEDSARYEIFTGKNKKALNDGIELITSTTTSEPHYLPPLARSASKETKADGKLGSIKEGLQNKDGENMIGLDDPGKNMEEEDDSYYEDNIKHYHEVYDYQAEYNDHDQHTTTTPTPGVQVVTNAPTTGNDASSYIGNDNMMYEEEDESYRELLNEIESATQKDDPIVFDYFKTHFVEEM